MSRGPSTCRRRSDEGPWHWAPGLQLVSRADGVWVRGTPSIAGTYTFNFIVNDTRGVNFQPRQYKMEAT
jgi:hypothetical protein